MKEIELYPNCSEVTWRLDYGDTLDEKEQIVNALMGISRYSEENSVTDTDSGLFGVFLLYLKDAEKKGLDMSKIHLDITENSGGNENYVYDMWELANKLMNKKITIEEAEKQEENWNY